METLLSSINESWRVPEGSITIALNCEVKMKRAPNPRSVLAILSSIVILVLICPPVYGQWVKIPSAIPRGPDGKPNFSAPAPRLPDGHLDLSGIWESGGGKYIQDIAADLKPGDVPFQPWAKTLVDQRADGSHSGEDPFANCLPQGVPRVSASPPPWKVIQKPDVIVILYESANTWRQVFLDGRELGKDFPPTFLGYSTGKWEGETLVVDTRGFNGKTWLDQTGKPTSDALHVTERFRRTDFGHMEIQITIDDPKVYTKPWTVKETVRLVPNTDVIENACENNLDLQHLGGKFSR
ncbi:MAG: hypothetical protein DMG15_19325 [Acidobacteria bacterium]|nr:MAG: hypothetical protein DMG15_19325 [Acidobacteriota bacterium]